jgi:hypothetical protein
MEVELIWPGKTAEVTNVVLPFPRTVLNLLTICVSIGYTAVMATKDVGLRVRVERGLQDDFLEACRLLDRPAAQVIREFMRSYVAKHGVESRSRRASRARTRSQVCEP